MRKLKQLRGLLIAFVSGLALGNTETGIKLCIIIPLVILLFMTYDEKAFDKRKKASYE